jgi:hypothetical protein
MSIAASTLTLHRYAERRLADRRRELASAPRPLVVDGGCDVRAGYLPVDHATRVALLLWLPLSTGELAALEDGLDVEAPADAVSLLLRPPTIWSLADALCLRRTFPDSSRAAHRTRARVAARHRRRVRAGAHRIEAQLPFAGQPRASAVVAAGCRALERDAACADVAARQLVRFAASDLVAAR